MLLLFVMLLFMKVASVSKEETTSLTEAKVGLAFHKINQIFQKSSGLNANMFLCHNIAAFISKLFVMRYFPQCLCISRHIF